MKTSVRHPLLIALALAGLLLFSTSETQCSCSPSEQCQLIRAVCKLDVCVKTDPQGWAQCESAPTSCGPDLCQTRLECESDFMTRCTARMAPGASGYARYQECARLDCSARPAPPPLPDAAAAPDAGVMCAGVMCGGACCTGYPCFAGERCTCLPSPGACQPTGGGEDAPPITPSCCSDAPLCASQGKLCCFVAATGGAPAQTRCLSACSSEARHCTFAPYLQGDATTSCLPPPYDTQGVLCPF